MRVPAALGVANGLPFARLHQPARLASVLHAASNRGAETGVGDKKQCYNSHQSKNMINVVGRPPLDAARVRLCTFEHVLCDTSSMPCDWLPCHTEELRGLPW